MSLIFNHLPANVSRALSENAQRHHHTVEEEAILALERGLAFQDNDDATWVENPQFDAALQAFAEMERE